METLLAEGRSSLVEGRSSRYIQKMKRSVDAGITSTVFISFQHDFSANLVDQGLISDLNIEEASLYDYLALSQEWVPLDERPLTDRKDRRHQVRSRTNTPVSAFDKYLIEFHIAEEASLSAYYARIEELRSDAADEGIVVSPDSQRDFWDFVTSRAMKETGDLFVTEEGHLRFVWTGSDSDHLGIRFLGNQTVRYVIFMRRPGESNISRAAGDDSFDGVVRQAHSFGLPVFVA